ncbi:MAG: hypothetical protein MUP14_10245 [Dehalococcoidia bacterium]|nr:hypothetical protein [Dehalococcoidia bacterium]
MNEQDLYENVKAALQLFFLKDCALLELTVNECSISHKLAEHLQYLFKEYEVDCEYNRHGIYPKRIHRDHRTDAEGSDGRVFPDIVIHKRGHDERNLLAIEIKKRDNTDVSGDVEKLEVLTGQEFGYKTGLLIIFDVQNKILSDVVFFQDGGERENTAWDNLRGIGHAG